MRECRRESSLSGTLYIRGGCEVFYFVNKGLRLPLLGYGKR